MRLCIFMLLWVSVSSCVTFSSSTLVSLIWVFLTNLNVQNHIHTAARLGMFRLKTELEDAAFRTLYPHSHSAVSSLCATPDVGEGMKSVLSDISNQMKRLVQEDTYFMEHIQNVSITARLKEP